MLNNTQVEEIKVLEEELKAAGWKESGIGLWVKDGKNAFVDTNAHVATYYEDDFVSPKAYGYTMVDLGLKKPEDKFKEIMEERVKAVTRTAEIEEMTLEEIFELMQADLVTYKRKHCGEDEE